MNSVSIKLSINDPKELLEAAIAKATQEGLCLHRTCNRLIDDDGHPKVAECLQLLLGLGVLPGCSYQPAAGVNHRVEQLRRHAGYVEGPFPQTAWALRQVADELEANGGQQSVGLPAPVDLQLSDLRYRAD